MRCPRRSAFTMCRLICGALFWVMPSTMSAQGRPTRAPAQTAARQQSQSGLLVVTVAEADTGIARGDLARINGSVLEAAQLSTRFETVMNGQSSDLLRRVIQERQSPEAIISAALSCSNCAFTPRYLLVVRVTVLDIRTGVRTKGADSVATARVGLQVELLDIETFASELSRNIERCSALLCRFEAATDATPGGAISGALHALQKDATEFLMRARPPRVVAVEEEGADGAAMRLLVDAGSAQNVRKGEHFRVVEMRRIEGESRAFPFTLGRVEIAEIAESSSSATVSEGGDRIARAMTGVRRLIHLQRERR